MREIKLTRGLVALVDDDDFQRINQFKWYASKYKDKYYAATTFRFNSKNFHLKLHQFILGEVGIDHIDNDGLNCQKSNIRKCTQHQNMMNKIGQKNKSSIYKGVYYSKRDRVWITQISINSNCISIGRFKNEIEAAKSYDNKAIELFGEFAYLNFK